MIRIYIPKDFSVEDQGVIYEFIRQHNFGILVSHTGEHPVATHLPFLLDTENHCLYSHLARANKQWENLAGQEVLIIFPGPHAYISSSWYETTQSVPTWNYVAVHAYGKIEMIEEPSIELDLLKQLVARHEESDSVYTIDESNQAYVQGLSRGIVSIKCPIDRLEGKWKLSQNHTLERQTNVINQLEKSKHEDARKIAALMRNNLSQKEEQ